MLAKGQVALPEDGGRTVTTRFRAAGITRGYPSS